jgi:hypothetical protein
MWMESREYMAGYTWGLRSMTGLGQSSDTREGQGIVVDMTFGHFDSHMARVGT